MNIEEYTLFRSYILYMYNESTNEKRCRFYSYFDRKNQIFYFSSNPSEIEFSIIVIKVNESKTYPE